VWGMRGCGLRAVGAGRSCSTGQTDSCSDRSHGERLFCSHTQPHTTTDTHTHTQTQTHTHTNTQTHIYILRHAWVEIVRARSPNRHGGGSEATPLLDLCVLRAYSVRRLLLSPAGLQSYVPVRASGRSGLRGIRIPPSAIHPLLALSIRFDSEKKKKKIPYSRREESLQRTAVGFPDVWMSSCAVAGLSAAAAAASTCCVRRERQGLRSRRIGRTDRRTDRRGDAKSPKSTRASGSGVWSCDWMLCSILRIAIAGRRGRDERRPTDSALRHART